MFKFEVCEELSCKATGSGIFYAKKGSMIAFNGQFNFEKLILGPDNGNGMMGALIGYAGRRLTGEQMELMTVNGSGTIYLAENAYHIELIDLEPGESVYVESENLLAFDSGLKYSVTMIGSGVISQKGLFTTMLQNTTGQVQQVAIITDGNPIILQGPCCVDPDAIVAWTGREPYPRMAQMSWKNLIGQHSGESYHLEFVEAGQVVIIQPSERLSGLRVSID